MFSALLLITTGCIAGVLAGLLGVGGGLIMVPVLSYLYADQLGGVAAALPFALGTSLATIVFTGSVSAYSHHRRGAVDWRVTATLAPGLIIGTLLAAAIAARIPGEALRIFFSLFVLIAAWQMWTNKRPAATQSLPSRASAASAGVIIGIVSGLVGIGGGTLTVPYLIWHGMAAQRAVAISAAGGIVIALAGTAGYAWHGPADAILPNSTGYILWTAVALLAVGSMSMAPLGAALAHRLPAARLKRVFALLLTLIAAKMLLA